MPYHYRGDTNPLSLGVGNYTFLVSVYSQDNASGIFWHQQTISFTISDTPPCDPIQLVCESKVNNNGCNHGDCTVVVCQGDHYIFSVNPNGAQFSSMTGPNGYNATSSGGNDFLISPTSVNQSHAGNYYVI
ncbi:MAG: hypothetical protein R2788_11025 [Saprospiraceae bacterium]